MLTRTIRTLLDLRSGRRWFATVLLLVGLYTVRWVLPHDVPTRTLDTLRLRLSHEYFPPNDAEFSDRELLKQNMKARSDVRIDECAAKGLVWGKYLRLSVSVAGAPPPDGRTIRYFIVDAAGMPTGQHDGFAYYTYLW